MSNANESARAYEYGEQAAMRGLTRDACPYRRQDLTAHWLRGWHTWHASQPEAPLSDDEKYAWRVNLARLRSALIAHAPANLGGNP